MKNFDEMFQSLDINPERDIIDYKGLFTGKIDLKEKNMKNFEFTHEGEKYWYSRSIAMLAMVVGYVENGSYYILANKRGKNTPDFQGCWCMPCGYLDFDETTEQAIVREVFEEIGVKLDVNDFYLHSIDSIPDDEKQNVTIRYKIKHPIDINKYELTKKNSDDGEVDDVKWIRCIDILDYKWAFNHDELIEKYVLGINIHEI